MHRHVGLRVRGHAAGLQLARDIRELLLRGLQDERLGGVGQGVPVGTVAEISFGVGRAEREASEGGHSGRQRHARHDLEFHACCGDAGNLVLNGLAAQRVASHETDDVPALVERGLELREEILCRVFDDGGSRGGGARRLATRAVGLCLGADAGVLLLGGIKELLWNRERGRDGLANTARDLRIDDGKRVMREHLTGTNGQQVWTSADEDDFAQWLRGVRNRR